jgi:hypothetical protein
MKSANFGVLLRAFAEALTAVGALDAKNQLLLLAGLFDSAPTANVPQVVKRLRALEPLPGSRRPTNGEMARLLPSLGQLLEKVKSGAADDFEEVAGLLRDRGSMELGDFVRGGVELLAAKPERAKARQRAKTSKGTAPALPLRDDLVSNYQQRLEAHLADKDRFAADYKDLCSNTVLEKDEVIALAKRMTGSGSRSKDTALKKIWTRHQSLMTSLAKSKATGGRSAA